MNICSTEEAARMWPFINRSVLSWVWSLVRVH